MPFFQSLSSMFGGRAASRPTQEGFSLPTTQFEQASSLSPRPGHSTPDDGLTPGPSRRHTSFQPGQYPPPVQQQHPPLTHTFHRLRNALVDDFPELLDSLNPPAPGGLIASVEQELGMPLPPAVREYFLVCDGQDLEANGQGIFYGLYLLPLDEVMREWQFWRAAEADPSTGANPAVLATMASIPPQWVKSVYACRGWLPLLSDRSGNYVGVDLDPGPQGQWGQAIIFGRDFDRKSVLWRGEGESGWAKWVGSLVEEIESRDGWEVDKSDSDEDEIGYSSYSGANMYGDGGHSMRLAGEYKGWNVLEAWWDKSVRKWEGLGLGMDVAEIERGLDEARRIADESKGKGKESARNSIEVAGIRSNQLTAEVEIPVLSAPERPESPSHSPAIPQLGDDSAALLPGASPNPGEAEVSAIPRILHPKGNPSRITTTSSHPLESSSSSPSPSSGPVSPHTSGSDYLLPPSRSSTNAQRRRSRPPPPAAVLDLPTRADVQAAQAVANAESRGLRGGWVMSLDASSGAAARRRPGHNVSPSLDAEMVDIDLEGGRGEAFGTPPMSAIDEEKQAQEDRLSLAGIEQRSRSPVPNLLGMSRTPSPLASPASPLGPSPLGQGQVSPPQGQGYTSPPRATSPPTTSSGRNSLISPVSSRPSSRPVSGIASPSPLGAVDVIRRPEPVVGYRSVSPVPDDWHGDVIRGAESVGLGRRRSSATPTATAQGTPRVQSPVRQDSAMSNMSAEEDGRLLPDRQNSAASTSTVSSTSGVATPPNGLASSSSAPKKKSTLDLEITEGLEEVAL